MDTSTAALPPALADAVRDDASLRRFLHELPGVDAAGLESRAMQLAARSIKRGSKRLAIDLAISMMDLTTLEGADTPDAVRSLCTKARRPDNQRPDSPQSGEPQPASAGPDAPPPAHPDPPPVAAVCVYPDMVATAADALAGSPIRVASVATGFPAGRTSLEVKVADVRLAVGTGAAEVDMVIDRGAFLSGRYGAVLADIREVKRVCGAAHLKVILETGELATYDNVRRASWLALLGGADFIKTSTGKVTPAATLPVTHLMLQAVRDWHGATGTRCGVKPAGGIRTTKDAIRYLVAVHEVAGSEWLTPDLFRFGASGLLNDLLMQRRAQFDGHYPGADDVSRG